MITLTLLLSISSVAPVLTVDDVLERLAEGAAPTQLADRIETAGFHLELTPRQAVELHADGVPAVVIVAIISTQGGEYPRLEVRGDQLEFHYDSYRIIGSMGRAGPLLQITGYDRSGVRLAPAVEAAPEPPRREPVARAPVVAVDDEWDYPDSADTAFRQRDEPVKVEITVNTPQPIAVAPPYPNYFTHTAVGVPGYVTVTRLPPGLLQGRALVHGYDAPAFGFGYYGYGKPFYGAWSRHAPRYPSGHVYYHNGYGASYGHGYYYGHGARSRGIVTYAGRGVR